MAEPYIGQMIMFGGNFGISGWATCDGQLLSISQNTALFSILGTTYGGDGRTTFGLPDLRGRVPIHPGTGPGLTKRRLGEKSGAENVTLVESQLPPHSHSASLRSTANEGDSSDPSGKYPARSEEPVRSYHSQATSSMASDGVVVGNTGGGASHNNMQPFLGVNFLIALVGVFPKN